MKSFTVSLDAVSHVVAALPEAAQDPDAGIYYDDGTLHVPDEWEADTRTAIAAATSTDAIAARSKESLTAYAAAKRFEVETGGIVVAGQRIDTSRESQSMISGAYALVSANSAPIRFKAASGWVTLSPADVQAVAFAVGAHVQTCFAIEAELSEEIDAGTVTDVAAIDAAEWPENRGE